MHLFKRRKYEASFTTQGVEPLSILFLLFPIESVLKLVSTDCREMCCSAVSRKEYVDFVAKLNVLMSEFCDIITK